MKILAIGDVVGEIGCQFLRERLPSLKKTENIDLVIANGENSADGNGITKLSAEYMFSSGVDVITLGNHTFRRNTTPGNGFTVYDLGRIQVTIINLMGCMFMDALNDPYTVIDDILKKTDTKIKILDFHAEATAEKLAMAYYLDGKISAMFGTHTHVQTSDERIFPHGMGYITDVGMTGPYESVLGVVPEIAVRKFKEKLPVKFETADGKCRLDCIKFTISDKTGKTLDVKRIEIV